jgi:hypothetical protein
MLPKRIQNVTTSRNFGTKHNNYKNFQGCVYSIKLFFSEKGLKRNSLQFSIIVRLGQCHPNGTDPLGPEIFITI